MIYTVKSGIRATTTVVCFYALQFQDTLETISTVGCMREVQSDINYCWQPMGDPVYDGGDMQIMGRDNANVIKYSL